MGDTFSLMDIIFVIAGLYVLFMGYQMKFKGEIKVGSLIPREANVKKCRDKEAYIKELFPKTMIYGVLVTIWGIVSLANDKFQFLSNNVYLALVAVFLLLTAWFAYAAKKLYEKYWPQPKKPVKKK